MSKSKQEMTYTCPVCDAYCATEKDDYFDDDCILVCGKGHWTAPKRLWPATHILKPLSARAFVDSFDSTVVFTMRHHDVDYVKLEDYTKLAATMVERAAIDANDALRRLAVLARDYMASSVGVDDVDKYFKIVSAALSSPERSARR